MLVLWIILVYLSFINFSTNTRTFLTCLPLHFRLHPFFIVFFFFYTFIKIFFSSSRKKIIKYYFWTLLNIFFFGLMVKLSKYICTLESMYEKIYFFIKIVEQLGFFWFITSISYQMYLFSVILFCFHFKRCKTLKKKKLGKKLLNTKQ